MWTTSVLFVACLSCSQTLASPGGDPSAFLLPPPPGEQLEQSLPAITQPPPSILEPALTISPPFYQRVAQWFGIGPTETSQPAQTSEFQQRHGESSELEPTVQTQKQKATCNPCNKVPWTPMLSSAQRSLSSGHDEANSLNNGYPVYSSYRPLPPSRHEAQSYSDFKQPSLKPILDFRNPIKYQANSYNSYQATKEDHSGYAAVRTQQQQFPQRHYYQPIYNQYPNFNSYKVNDPLHKTHIALPTYSPKQLYATGLSVPSHDYRPAQPLIPLQYSDKHHLLPIPVPNLSVLPLPPLFGPKAFRQPQNYGQAAPQLYPSSNVRPQPPFDYEHTQSSASPNSTPHSIPNDVVINAKIPSIAYPTLTSDVEIIPSISLAEFTSSVEYPAPRQPPRGDFTAERQPAPVVESYPKPSQTYSQPEYLAAPIVVDQYDHSVIADNFHSASSANATIKHPEFNKDDSIQSIQSQLTSGHQSIPITILPDLFPPETTLRPSSPHFTSSSNSFSKPPASNVVHSIKRDRETPKDMLDSPIYYLNKSNQQQRTTKSPNYIQVSRLPEYDNTPWTPSNQQGILRITSPPPQEPTQRPTRHSFISPNNIHSNHQDDGTNKQNVLSSTNKKPKQIQIIIPYTTKNRPSQFQPPQSRTPTRFQNFDSNSGWTDQSHHGDSHDSQESKVVTSTITQSPPPSKTTKYLTKILASNLKDLLKKEKSNTTQLNSLDFSRLQKNIDVWTEQEFSTPNKASTVSLSQSQAKIIPSEYLTTTPITDRFTQTELSDASEATTTSEPLLADEAYSKFDDAQNSILDPSDQSDLWTKLMLSISPSTQEKVYVVTPQPWRDTPKAALTLNVGSGFKSPRFLVRPTPGPQSTSSAEAGFSFPESVNRLQSSWNVETTTSRTAVNFRPSTQVEQALDGHSKMFQMVTPPTFAKNIISNV